MVLFEHTFDARWILVMLCWRQEVPDIDQRYCIEDLNFSILSV